MVDVEDLLRLQQALLDELTDQPPGIFGRLGADVVVKKNGSAAGLPGHRRDDRVSPFLQFFIAVVVVKLHLHIARAPSSGVTAVKSNIEKFRIGDHIQSREQARQRRFIHSHQCGAAALQLGKNPIRGP